MDHGWNDEMRWMLTSPCVNADMDMGWLAITPFLRLFHGGGNKHDLVSCYMTLPRRGKQHDEKDVPKMTQKKESIHLCFSGELKLTS